MGLGHVWVTVLRQIPAAGRRVWAGGVTGVGGIIGRVFDLSDGTARKVTGTVGAYQLTASGNVLWYYQAGKLVEISG